MDIDSYLSSIQTLLVGKILEFKGTATSSVNQTFYCHAVNLVPWMKEVFILITGYNTPIKFKIEIADYEIALRSDPQVTVDKVKTYIDIATPDSLEPHWVHLQLVEVPVEKEPPKVVIRVKGLVGGT